MNNISDPAWYALRITYSRELAFKEFLDKEHIENFIPMQYKYVKKGEKIIRKLVPVIHNLVFVRCTSQVIEDIKSRIPANIPVRYIMDRETHTPLIVPDIQMKNFIAVAGTYDDRLVYLDTETSNLQKGDRVRVTGGVFAGVEGRFVRIKGNKRVVVSIQGVMAVATAYIPPALVERII